MIDSAALFIMKRHRSIRREIQVDSSTQCSPDTHGNGLAFVMSDEMDRFRIICKSDVSQHE